jgi:hypothetical protein
VVGLEVLFKANKKEADKEA